MLRAWPETVTETFSAGGDGNAAAAAALLATLVGDAARDPPSVRVDVSEPRVNECTLRCELGCVSSMVTVAWGVRCGTITDVSNSPAQCVHLIQIMQRLWHENI